MKKRILIYCAVALLFLLLFFGWLFIKNEGVGGVERETTQEEKDTEQKENSFKYEFTDEI